MTVILNKANKGSKIIRGLWLCFVGFLLLFAMLIFAIDKGWLGYMPSMAELENPRADLSSDIIAKDQTTIVGRYFKEDRSNITYKDISPYVINALYATEDARFTEHSGIDPLATIAIIYYAIIHKKRGSSTITQQLAKNLFPRESEAFWAMPIIKLKEMVMAVKLERNLTKQEIVTLYLSRVPFGDNVYGIRNASLTFYNKKPDSSLTINEAAMLIGMLKGNTIYNPRTHPAKALERRNVVLDQMIKYKYLDGAEGQMLKEKKDSLNYHKITYHDGIAPYFRQVLEAEVKNALKDLKKPNGEPYDIYKDGLKIYTTIDIRMQQYAEEAMEEHLRELQKQFMAQRGYSDGKIWESNKANIKSILNSSIKASERYKSYMELNMTDAQAMDSMRVRRKTRLFAWKTGHQIDTTISGVDSVKYMKTFLQAGFMVLDPTNAQVKAWVGGIDHKFFQYDHVNKNTKRQVGSTIKPLLYTLAIKNGGTPCDMLS
ncbi:MAG: penicillin-binding protein, partial [Chitinophagia bacterium]|nr:penicillin-binding protein [Chitinophagia bacterium]